MAGIDVFQFAADQAFGGADGVGRVDGLALQGGLAGDDLPGGAVAHHRGQQEAAFFIGQADGMAAFHGGYQAVGGAQVDADG